jgi:large subunit ribosomal protein L21
MEVAVIKTGGKQYVVSKGDLITIEKLGSRSKTVDLKKGDTVVFDEVLMTDDGSTTNLGTPTVKGASVTGTVHMVGRHTKIDVVKYKAKSRYLKRRGHRQPYLKIRIEGIK